MKVKLLNDIATLDAVLLAHARELGDDFAAYRNHAYRVVNLCAALHPADGEHFEKVAIAAAFHDLGIWTNRTFDYLQPSIGLACAHLTNSGRADWTPEISVMIGEHHKIFSYRGEQQWLVEPFRRADWIDVSRGVIGFGLPRTFLREVFSTWPNAGLHKRLVQLSLRRARTHPWNPLPMLKP